MSGISSQSSTKSAIIHYTIGFVLSLGLTLVAFMLVFQYLGAHHDESSRDLITFTLVGFAITQLAVQMVFFLHLGQEKRPRWNFIIFIFMLLTLGIIVFGSLWIMDNLNYNMMSPEETKAYMKDHQGF